MSDWEVPGHDVLELLGYGSTGEVWRARERSSGQLVVLRRLAGSDREAVAEVRRQATVVRSLPTRHLVRLRTVTRSHGDDVLVLDHAGGGSLEALLALRGTLSPGEVVTVLAPLAEALGHAHAHGLCHRRVRAPRVLLTSDGMPVLEGLGLESLYDAADSLDPTGVLGSTADVWALGALGRLLLTGEGPTGDRLAEQVPAAPLPLVRALEAAMDPDPLARPAAADLAATLLAACPAAPLLGLPHPPLPPEQKRPVLANRRPALIAAAAGVALLGVIAIGWTWGARSADATASVARARSSASQAPAVDWVAQVQRLDGVRAQAFNEASPAILNSVYAPGSPALAADRASLAALARRHARVQGLTHRVLSATRIGADGDETVLRVVEQLTAYTLVDAHDKAVERHTAGPAVTQEVVLVPGADGWRVREVRAT
jgi:hypothetical protein